MVHTLIVIMGPSGSGKSRVSAALAQRMDLPVLEGDDFHPETNRQKMASGQPLSDQDRAEWITCIEQRLKGLKGQTVILACSALTAFVQYRLQSFAHHQPRFILLDAPRDVLFARMQQREGHFMPVSLLDSQLEALSAPQGALVIDARMPVEAIVSEISAALS
ncbi:MAG: gluconokinase, GntK/IdnK-type [Pseudomonadota bacterium]|nr:gluconokinase, GntK/IdnK-type [Pseudomonadota bacterium]